MMQQDYGERTGVAAYKWTKRLGAAPLGTIMHDLELCYLTVMVQYERRESKIPWSDESCLVINDIMQISWTQLRERVLILNLPFLSKLH